MSLKILTIGDPHSKRSNQPEIKECGDKIAQKIKETEPNAVVILGDLADNHDRVYISSLHGTVYFIEAICTAAASLLKPAKVYYIIGNHDYETNQCFLTENHTFNAFKKWQNFIVIDTVLRLKTQLGSVVMCPYTPPGRFVEALDTIGRDKWTDAMAIFCHQEFLGSKLNGLIASKVGDKWETTNPLVISGHIHNYNRLQTNIIFVGAPMYHTFGEDLEASRTISLFDFQSASECEETRFDLGLPKKLTIDLSIAEAQNYNPPENSHVRLNLTGTTQEHNQFKQTEKFAQLSQVVKIIPQITDKIVIPKNFKRLGYIEILTQDCAKEDKLVQEALQEVLSVK